VSASTEGAGERAGRALRSVARAALDLLLPPTCATCDATVDAPGLLCADCFVATDFVTDPCCARCGAPFAYAAQGGLSRQCRQCERAPPLYDRARGALRYDAQARRMVFPFKYGDRTELASALAPLMARAGAALLRDATLLVPVPLHRGRLRARRYNQAAMLARALGRLAGKPVAADALVRLRATRPLHTLAGEARAREVTDAFAVRPSRAARVMGARVLLVDDLLTSGSTANACTLALRDAGATGVDVLVAARVADPSLR
jgi:ComF family protein